MIKRQFSIAAIKALGRFGAAGVAALFGLTGAAAAFGVLGLMALLGNIEALVAQSIADYGARLFGVEWGKGEGE